MAEDAAVDGQGTTGAEDGGGQEASFLDGIQDEGLRGNESLKDFKSADDLAKAFVDLKGAQQVVPENIDAYEFEIPEDGVKIDEAGMNAFKQTALEAKLTSEQYKAVVGFRAAEIASAQKAAEKARDDAVKAMKKEYGAEYDAKLDAAQKVLLRFEAADILDVANPEDAAKSLGNSPALMRFLVKVSEAISEDTFERGGRSAEGDKMERDDAGRPILRFKDM